MNCGIAREWIDEAADGTLDPRREAELAAHLAACQACRVGLEALRRTRELLAAVPKDGPSEETLRRIWAEIEARIGRKEKNMGAAAIVRRRWFQGHYAAAAAAVLLLIGAYIIGATRQGRNLSAEFFGSACSPAGGDEEVVARTLLRAEPPRAAAPERYAGDDEAAELRAPIGGKEVGRGAAGSVNFVAGRGGGGGEYEKGLADKSATASDMPARPSPSAAPAPKAPPLPQAERLARGYDYGERNKKAEAEAAGAAKGDEKRGEGAPEARSAAASLKIIRTGELGIEVARYEDAYRQAEVTVRDHGGHIADSRVTQESDGSTRGRIVVRVPCEKFEALFGELRKLGRVESENVSAQDVTAEYTDLEARLKNARTAEARLLEIMKSKSILDKMEELLKVEREVMRVREEIERMEGRMRVMQDRIAFSTINLTLRERSLAVPGASMSVEVRALNDAWQSLSGPLVQAGAQVLHSSVTRRGDGTLQGNYTLRIKLTQFAAIVSAIEKLGRVEGRDLRGQTLTAALPDRADRVNCDISLVLFERSRPIPSGCVGIAVSRLKDAEERLAALLSQIEGQVVSSSTERRGDGTSASNLTVQVPLAKFDALLRGLEGLGRVESRQVQGQEFGEVVGGAASVPCRLSVSICEKTREVPRGEIRLLVRNFREAADLFDRLVLQHKAEIADSNVSTRPDRTWAGSYNLRVPATAAEALAADVEKLGRVQYKSVQGMGLTGAEKPGPDVMGHLTVRIEEMSALTPPEDEEGGPMRRAIIGGLKGLSA
ncbi:MAG: DUF4349 domain-containing protein, partial [Planctomycetota bacterium]|nr:DUF4349 domain-containing protein [Planctomycetota bacterium]